MAERMGAKVRSHHVDHTPMYTEPNLVIDMIIEAAREALSPIAVSPQPTRSLALT
jgi:hypothetical protein